MAAVSGADQVYRERSLYLGAKISDPDLNVEDREAPLGPRRIPQVSHSVDT